MNSDMSHLSAEQRGLFTYEIVSHSKTFEENDQIEWQLQEFFEISALPVNCRGIEDELSFFNKKEDRREAKYMKLWKRAGAGTVKPKKGTDQAPKCGFVVGLSWCPLSQLPGCVVGTAVKKSSKKE